MFVQALRYLTLASVAMGLSVPVYEERDNQAPELKGRRSVEVRDSIEHTVFEHDATGAKIDFVTNSGVCETTPGVNQYSGYLSVGSMINQLQVCWGPANF
jgi:hypothetical protein